jgi:CHRD domain
MYKHRRFFMFAAALAAISMWGCEDKEVTPTPITRQFSVKLNAKNEIPAPLGRLETGIANFILYADNRLQYTVKLNPLVKNDKITMSHIHSGDAGTNGPVSITFDVSNAEGNAFGGLVQLTQAQADLVNGKLPAYVNVHTVQVPGGLMRGQTETEVMYARDLPLSGGEEVPMVYTPTKGTIIFRETTDGNLYSRVTVTGLPSDDAITASHIHTGAKGTNGAVAINLFPGGASDLGKMIKTTLTAAQLTTLNGTGPIYANVHSTKKPGGIVRGQMR